VVADLMKLWLRSLTEPLVPFSLYERAVEAGRSTDYLMAYKLLLALPQANAATLKVLMRFLNDCADHSVRSQMNRHNLSLVFSPNLLRCPTNDPAVMMANTEPERKFTAFLLDAVRQLAADAS
jgi:Rho GTPase-activating protein 39